MCSRFAPKAGNFYEFDISTNKEDGTDFVKGESVIF